MRRLLIPLLVLLGIVLGVVGWNSYTKVQNKDIKNSSEKTSKVTQTSEVNTECSGKALPQLTEGPYYKEGSPEMQDILTDRTAGVELVLSGVVFDTDCRPISNAWIDFWQADGNGEYDNNGYNLRGHQFTDSNGKYNLITVIPGLYPGRTEHIHFKIRSSEASPVVTSQLFLPDSESNSNDNIFDTDLVIKINEDRKDMKRASYNFVIER